MVGCVKKITARTLQITEKYSNIYHQNLLRILATHTKALTSRTSESGQVRVNLVNWTLRGHSGLVVTMGPSFYNKRFCRKKSLDKNLFL